MGFRHVHNLGSPPTFLIPRWKARPFIFVSFPNENAGASFKEAKTNRIGLQKWVLIKKMAAMGIYLKINHWVGDFLKKTEQLERNWGGHLSNEGTIKVVYPRALCLVPFLFLIYINDLAGELTCNNLFFADDVKLIARRRQQRELRSSIQQTFSWFRRCK